VVKFVSFCESKSNNSVLVQDVDRNVDSCEQNQKRLKLLLTAFNKHNKLMMEAQDGQGTEFT